MRRGRSVLTVMSREHSRRDRTRHHVPHAHGKAADFIFYAEELSGLSEKQRKVLQLRVGLVDGRQHSQREIGDLLGISSERVRQIQAAALRACREQ